MKNLLFLGIFFILFQNAFSQNSSNIEEKNLKTDLNKYTSALHDQNIEELRKYLYSDMFLYLKNEYPEDYNEEFMREVLNNFISLFIEAKKQGFSLNTRTGKVIQLLEEKNKKIYLIELFLDGEKGLKKITTGSYVLGISLDNGKNFQFLSYDEELAPAVLKYQFSPSSIAKIKSEIKVRT